MSSRPCRIARWAVPFTVAAAVAGALPGIAFGDPFSATNPFFGAGLDQQKRQEASRKSPAAKAERLASRTRWLGLSAGQSRALGRRTFPETFASDLFDGALPGPGLKIVQYRGGGVAVAETSTGERLLVRSSAPLRAQAPNGALEPVDLSLRESADTFSTTNSNADLRISKNPADGTELLGRDIAIALDTDKRSTGTAADGRVFYADVDTDTDYVVAPLPDGGEFSWLLRSPKAPERFVLDFKIPQGAKVRRAQSKNPIPGDPPENLEIVDGDKVLGYIEAPRTYDADNTPVKSQLVILGDNRVAMTVKHQGRDLRYPLLADPEVVVPNDYSRGWLGWRNWYSHGANWNANTNYYGFALFDPAYNANGVYLSMPTNTYFWPQGTGVNFSYTAPADTYVYRTIMGSIGHNPMPFWYSYGYLFSHIYSGILNSANNNWEAGQSWQSNYGSGAQGIFGPYGYAIGNLQLDHCFETRCNRAAGSEQNQADFGLAAINNYNSNNIFTGNEKATATMGYASVFLGDRYNPWMRSDAQPPNRDWTDDSANPTHTLPGVTAEDKGLGIYGITLAGAASGNGTLRPSCDGDPNRNYCPKAWTAYGFSYQLNEGSTTLSLTPQDIVDNAGAAQTWTEKVDRSAPTLSLSGGLYDARNGYISSSQDLSLQAVATDGELTPASAQRSGVSSVTATVDGQPMTNSPLTVPCTRPEGSCALTLNTAITTAQLQALDGRLEHTVTITAIDALNQSSTQSFTFRTDSVEPATAIDDNLAQSSGRTLTEDSYRLRVEATDNLPFIPEVDDEGDPERKFDTPGAGLRDLIIRLDGQPVATSTTACFDDANCESARAWDWDTREVPNGEHTVEITATDRAGNANIREFQITLARAQDEGARNDLVRRTILGAELGDRAGSAVAALGDVNGDGFADYAVGAPGASGAGRVAAGATYLVLGSADQSTVDLASPGSSAFRLLGPGSSQYCGTSVAAVGDVNGDELADFVIGCPGVDSQTPLAASATGRVYVIFGRRDPQNVDLSAIGTAGYAITGPTDTLNLGLPLISVRPAVFGERLQSAPVGQANQDINDDGLADIVIGDSAVARNGATGAGAVYVVYGKEDSATVDTNALGGKGYVIRGDRAAGLAGYSATIVDDLDGDTLADVVIGAPGASATTGGRAYIVNGAAMNDQGELTNADVDLGTSTSRVVTLTSGEASDRFGVNVTAVGNTDLDPTPDIAIGTRAGAYVIRTVPTTNRQITVGDGFRVTGPANDPGLLATRVPEAPISPAGDLDGDEREDLVIGYPDAAGARAYTIRSPESTRTISVSALPGQRGAAITAGTQSDRAGAAVAANGYQGAALVSESAQAIIGAPATTAGLKLNAGRAYVVVEPAPSGPGVELAADPDQLGVSTSSPSSATTKEAAPSTATAAAEDNGRDFDRSFAALFPRPFGRFRADPVSDATSSITVRNDFQLLVIGNLFESEPIDVTFRQARRDAPSGTPEGDKPAFYYHGRAYGQVRRCGWVVAYQVDRLPEAEQPSGAGRRCGSDRRLSPHTFARLINCDHCNDASSVVLRGHSSVDRAELARRRGADAENVGRIPYWRNVQPGTDEGNSPPSNYIDVRNKDVRVMWRYLTRSKGRKFSRFALVRSPDASLFGNNKWAFIERRWLPSATGKNGLCDNTGGMGPRPNEASDATNSEKEPNGLDYEPQKAANSRKSFGRFRRSDWPSVCSHKLFGVPTP